MVSQLFCLCCASNSLFKCKMKCMSWRLWYGDLYCSADKRWELADFTCCLSQLGRSCVPPGSQGIINNTNKAVKTNMPLLNGGGG